MARNVLSNEHGERGATLLEFALVLPILLIVLMGVVDFGMRLADTHTLEDGIRVAAREAAVGNTGGDTGCVVVGSATPNTETNELVCMVKGLVGLPDSDVRVRIAFDSSGPVEGGSVLICAQYPGDSFTGLLPQFGSDAVSARSVMRLEADSAVATYAETSLTGGWTGCSF
jgi:hypothetical protein